MKDALRDPANLAAALGYYRATLGDVGVDPALDAVQNKGNDPTAAADAVPARRAPTAAWASRWPRRPPAFLTSEGSRMEVVDDAGHFLHVERPRSSTR